MPVDLAQAAAALEQNRPAEARPLLESATRSEPRNAMAWALLAQVYQRMGRGGEAAVAAARAEAAAGTGQPKVQHAIALFHAQSGNRRKAAEMEARYARSGEADPAAAARAALLHWETGNRGEAVALGELALSRGDGRVEVREMLARAYEAAGRAADSAAQWREVAGLRPASEEARGECGKALLRAGQFTAAALFLEEARRDFDKSPQIELALGVAYYSLRRFDEAAGRFLRVIELAPGIEQPYVFLARMIDQIPGRLSELAPRFAAWDSVEKANHYAPFVHAKVLQALGDAAGRVEPLLRESIRRQPKFWESHFELGQLIEQQPGKLAQAAEEYRAAIALNARQAAPHYRLARVYDRMGQKQLAARERQAHASLLAEEKGRPGMADPPRD